MLTCSHTPFDYYSLDGDDLLRLTLSMRKASLDGPFVAVSRPNQNARSSSSMSTQSPSVSVIQSRAQPSYALIEPGGRVLMRESPITIFAELTDKLTETCGHFWLFVKETPQTFPYLSANFLIVLCVNVHFAHVYTPMPCEGLPELYSSGNWRGLRLLSAIGLDRVR
jgi:hypothetical protein